MEPEKPFGFRMESDDEDDGPSNATILLHEKIDAEFKKAFPLRSETAKQNQLRQQLMQSRSRPSICKKLNFDDTMSPIAISLNTEMKSAKANLESNELRLAALQQELNSLKRKETDREARLQEAIRDKNVAKQQLIQTQANVQKLQRSLEVKTNEDTIVNEDWKMMAKKYYSWFQIANAQLEKIYDSVRRPSDWTPSAVKEINSIPVVCLKEMANVTFDEGYVAQLAQGSFQSFVGFNFVAEPEHADQTVTETAEQNTTTLFKFDASSTIFNVKQENNDPGFTSPSRDISSINDTMNSTQDAVNTSSIDYEKDDKIQRLLLENSILKDKLNVSVGRAQQSMVLEEKYRSMEMRNDFLQKKLDTSFGEIEAMRMGMARRLFTIDEGMSHDSKSLAYVDRIRELVADNGRLEKNFEAATSKMQKFQRDLRECEKRNSHLEDAYSEQTAAKIALEKELAELKSRMVEESRTDAIASETLRREMFDYPWDEPITSNRASEERTLQPQMPAYSNPTDAGNSTQILHIASNPLFQAHELYQLEESRKRKLSQTVGDVSPFELSAKMARDERIQELEERLRKSDRDKESALRIQSDLVKKFREISAALTGFQIKLKDPEEGLCCVSSIYNDEGERRQFVFKYYWDSGRLDLLDVDGGQNAASEDLIRKWEPEMRRYIGERQSIPAFLSAVTLRLEEQRHQNQTFYFDPERTHTFSVLHD